MRRDSSSVNRWTRIGFVSALFLGALFLYSAVDKLFHYEGFLTALDSYVLVQEGWAPVLAPSVVLAELWIGISLLLPGWRRRAGLAAAGAMAVFTVALVVNLQQGSGSVCGCWFTLTLGEGSVNHVLFNLVLLGLAVSVWRDRVPSGTAGRRVETKPA